MTYVIPICAIPLAHAIACINNFLLLFSLEAEAAVHVM